MNIQGFQLLSAGALKNCQPIFLTSSRTQRSSGSEFVWKVAPLHVKERQGTYCDPEPICCCWDNYQPFGQELGRKWGVGVGGRKRAATPGRLWFR
jgi:hypothetical protein